MTAESVEALFDQLDPAAPPFERYPAHPSNVAIREVVEHIKRFGRPETCEKLYRGRLSRAARYKQLAIIKIDPRKRLTGDMAPCPMCTPNRFLEGALVWCYELAVMAVVGRCCGDHAAEADRVWRKDNEREKQQDYLLEALPLLEHKIALLNSAMPTATEAIRLFRELRSKAPEIHQHLRTIKEKANARLVCTEILRRGADSDYVGPAGFRGRGANATETRDHDFGILIGTTAVMRDYEPTQELRALIRLAESVGFQGNAEAALQHVSHLDDDGLKAATVRCRSLDKKFVSFVERLEDVGRFFSNASFQRLNAYGRSPFNDFPFSIQMEKRLGVNLFSFSHKHRTARIAAPKCELTIRAPWLSPEFG